MKNSDNKRLLVIQNCGKSGKYQFTALYPRDLSVIGDESFDLPFLYPSPNISVNSCRDWLCIYEYRGHFYLWNPTTKQCLFFPTDEVSAFNETRTSLVGACVCYDSKSGDYKILRVREGDFPPGSFSRMTQTIELYSFQEDSWDQISPKMPFDNLEETYMYGLMAISAGGKFYWFNLLDRIVSLDSSEKSLSYIDLPPECHPSIPIEWGELVQFNGGDSLGYVRIRNRHPKVGIDFELWEWSEELKWVIKFSVSLGGAKGTVPATICGTFLFLYGRSGKLGDNEHRLVAYEWTKGDCKELGIDTNGVKIHILCYVEGTVVLPHGKHGKAINGSSFLINPPLVKLPNLFIRHCGCKGNKSSGCECCQPYSDAYKLSVEDVAANGFRILRDTEEEVGPDISKNQLAGNPGAQGGKKKKTPQGNISRHHLYKREGGSNICSDEWNPMLEALLKSNEVSVTFKQEIKKMAKVMKDLKEENTIMKSNCDKSDITIIELTNERELLKRQLEETRNLKKQLEETRNQKDKLESLCRSLQAERKTNSAASDSIP